eukprot:16447076-Heterocapsa_arctica.AAC.1
MDDADAEAAEEEDSDDDLPLLPDAASVLPIDDAIDHFDPIVAHHLRTAFHVNSNSKGGTANWRSAMAKAI